MKISKENSEDIARRAREAACANASIQHSIEEISNAVQDKKSKEGHISRSKIYSMLDDKISKRVMDIISELNISWEEIDLETTSSGEEKVAKRTFLSLIYAKVIEAIANELISKAQ